MTGSVAQRDCSPIGISSQSCSCAESLASDDTAAADSFSSSVSDVGLRFSVIDLLRTQHSGSGCLNLRHSPANVKHPLQYLRQLVLGNSEAAPISRGHRRKARSSTLVPAVGVRKMRTLGRKCEANEGSRVQIQLAPHFNLLVFAHRGESLEIRVCALAICDRAWTRRASPAARIGEIRKNLSARDFARSIGGAALGALPVARDSSTKRDGAR